MCLLNQYLSEHVKILPFTHSQVTKGTSFRTVRFYKGLHDFNQMVVTQKEYGLTTGSVLEQLFSSRYVECVEIDRRGC